jgi:acyl carrier protein
MRERILQVLAELRPEFDFTEPGHDFIEEGMIDSLDIVSIVDTAEEEYGVSIPGTDILPEHFCSVDAIVNLINKYRT